MCWVAAGICMGVYDNAIKYVSERRQFGQPISGNAIKLYRIPVSSIENCENNGEYSSCAIDVLSTFQNG